MPNLIKLEEELLAHNLQCADLPSILLLGEEDLAVTALTHLCKNLEITLAETNTALAEIGTLSPNIFLPHRIVGLFGGSWGLREFCLEVIESSLP